MKIGTIQRTRSRPSRTFEQAAAKFVVENQHKRSLHSDIGRLKLLMPWIGDIAIDKIHAGSLQLWIDHRRKQGTAIGTINHGLKVVRRILNLASTEWVDEFGMTWLQLAPRIKLLSDTNKRKPYPLSWKEQKILFDALPGHLANMALFAVNTGCRDAEICNLQWSWKIDVPQLATRKKISWLATSASARSQTHVRSAGNRSAAQNKL